MASVVAENITKKFGDNTAVDHLSFSIKEGEVFGFLGPNGAGKTTTIRLLTSLISLTEGTATVNGYDVSTHPTDVRKSVGVLTENPSLYERLSAEENLNFFGQAYGIDNKEKRQARIRELLEFFDLMERRKDKVGKYSKGMKQKLAIARSLMHEPSVLFMDEPTSGLDPAAAKEVRDLIAKLSRQEKRTILLCTHHLEDAEKLADKILIINKGRMAALGTPNELQHKVSHKNLVVISLAATNKKIIDAVSAVEGVTETEKNGDNLTLTTKTDRVTPDIVAAAVNAGGRVLSVSTPKPVLEDVYLKLVRSG